MTLEDSHHHLHLPLRELVHNLVLLHDQLTTFPHGVSRVIDDGQTSAVLLMASLAAISGGNYPPGLWGVEHDTLQIRDLLRII